MIALPRSTCLQSCTPARIGKYGPSGLKQPLAVQIAGSNSEVRPRS